jgi:hypothetical protein
MTNPIASIRRRIANYNVDLRRSQMTIDGQRQFIEDVTKDIDEFEGYARQRWLDGYDAGLVKAKGAIDDVSRG